jgi:hypothetical protein
MFGMWWRATAWASFRLHGAVEVQASPEPVGEATITTVGTAADTGRKTNPHRPTPATATATGATTLLLMLPSTRKE